MSEDDRYSVDGARAAGQRDDLAGWVAGFLASPGSDNPALAQQLGTELAWWAGPLPLPINQLHRLAGPAGDPVLCPVPDEYWDDRVGAMDQLAQSGWQPAPVIVAYRRDQLVLEDGNHRVESLRRAGKPEVWAAVGFLRREDRDRFVQDTTGPSTPTDDRHD
jgi:hypothetical protein